MTAETKIATHASSGGHWYSKTGEQVLEVKKADGSGMTPCTLKQARILDLARGVTSSISLYYREMLEIWKREQCMLAAVRACAKNPALLPELMATLEKPKIMRSEADKKLVNSLHDDAGEIARKAAEAGTAIHKAIQQSYQGEPFDSVYTAHVQGVRQLLLDVAPNAKWIAEKGVASAYGYGTKCDLFSDEWVIDFKGSEFDQQKINDGKVKLYDEHPMQLAATQNALVHSLREAGEPHGHRFRCAIIFVSRTVPGLCCMVEADDKDLARGWGMFRCLLEFQFEKDGWRPSWATKGFGDL